jgi:uncharacterized protein YybS (DUF2232 family)
VLVFQSWKQSLTEVVPVLIGEQAREVPCLLDLIYQEINEPLDFILLSVRHAITVCKCLLQVFRPLLGQYLFDNLLWICELDHEFLRVTLNWFFRLSIVGTLRVSIRAHLRCLAPSL